jgi:diketogulonate reductase-like aldo/keto reductase
MASRWRDGIVPSPGVTKPAHLDDNLPVADLGLTPDDLQEIDAAFAAIGPIELCMESATPRVRVDCAWQEQPLA